MSSFPEIKTNHYLLRQFSERDLRNVYRGLSDTAVIKYYGINFESVEAAKAQLSWFAALEKNETGIWWAICAHDNTLFYGAGGFNSWNKKFKKAEIGFWLLPEFWQTGIMSETFPVICRYGFEQLGLHRIEAQVESENTACLNALKKFNFIHEGTMRACEIKDDKYIDLEIYSKLRSDKE